MLFLTILNLNIDYFNILNFQLNTTLLYLPTYLPTYFTLPKKLIFILTLLNSNYLSTVHCFNIHYKLNILLTKLTANLMLLRLTKLNYKHQKQKLN
jgi:hypothetical protein